jgi:hypothetical protein
VANVLADPRVQLFDAAQARIAENDNFAAAEQSVFASVGDFWFLAGARDAALVVSLPAGGYTAQVSGADGGSGAALVEIYELN